MRLERESWSISGSPAITDRARVWSTASLPDGDVDSLDHQLERGSIRLDVDTCLAARRLEKITIATRAYFDSSSSDHELRIVLAGQRMQRAARVSTKVPLLRRSRSDPHEQPSATNDRTHRVHTRPAIAAHRSEIGNAARREQTKPEFREVGTRISELAPRRHLDLGSPLQRSRE
jgi:hypothetical protein